MDFPQSPPIIVFGMHRSGTSLLAGLLSDLGVHIGKELDEHNESILFKNINRELLRFKRAHWARVEPFLSALDNRRFLRDCHTYARASLKDRCESYGDATLHRTWGWKDPRNTLTLPVWLLAFPDAKLIHVVRNGLEVALSMHRRELRRWINKSTEKRMFPPTIGASYRLWEIYYQLGQAHQFHPDSLCVRYENLLTNSAECIVQIAEFTGTSLSQQDAAHLARRRIRQPRKRSKWEKARLRMLSSSGILDLKILEKAGYTSAL